MVAVILGELEQLPNPSGTTAVLLTATVPKMSKMPPLLNPKVANLAMTRMDLLMESKSSGFN